MLSCPARRSAAERTSLSKLPRTCLVVSTPTSAAKAARMTKVRAADPPANRQRTGIVLYAENVARAADRMEEPVLSTGLKLPSQVGHEHLDGVGHGKRVIAPHLVQQTLAGDHDQLVSHQVFQQLKLSLR